MLTGALEEFVRSIGALNNSSRRFRKDRQSIRWVNRRLEMQTGSMNQPVTQEG